jgi:hypothetical protein
MTLGGWHRKCTCGHVPVTHFCEDCMGFRDDWAEFKRDEPPVEAELLVEPTVVEPPEDAPPEKPFKGGSLGH